MSDEKFNERLKKAADIVGGQAALARKTKISIRSVNAYCMGDSDPSRERLVAMADATGVNISWLAAGRGEMRDGESCQVCQLEDPIITEIKLFLRDMTRFDSGYPIWFRVELMRKFEDFKAWREKKRTPDQFADTGSGVP